MIDTRVYAILKNLLMPEQISKIVSAFNSAMK